MEEKKKELGPGNKIELVYNNTVRLFFLSPLFNAVCISHSKAQCHYKIKRIACEFNVFTDQVLHASKLVRRVVA